MGRPSIRKQKQRNFYRLLKKKGKHKPLDDVKGGMGKKKVTDTIKTTSQ